ncbi:MAG: Rrf2 family transcriptional regulator [Bacteroidetes bacterium]|nr:Rrf2 family transcriptional regulator [Bacteroidota bacterium]
MLQLSKKVGYALIALRHMATHPQDRIFTAREIAAACNIPYELLAKILQKLKKSEVIVSTQGMRGGYSLLKKPDQIQVSQIINAIEEEKAIIADCYADSKENCSLYDTCTIRTPLGKVQHNLDVLLESTTLDQIV